MNLFKILRRECIATGVTLKDKADALNEVVRVAGECELFRNVSKEDILKSLEKREETGSTGFGKGIAIPHCRLPNIDEFVVGILTVPEGVKFDSLDGKPVNLIIFIIGPDYESNEHIRILSVVSRILHMEGVIDELLAQKSSEALYESFLRYSQDHIETKERGKKQLCYVFVQDENVFEDILEVFSSMETSSVSVIEGKNTREFLVRNPLFAGFWGDSHLGSNRIITAVIDMSLTNETLRSIERITGHLDERNDILVIVQNIFYTAGSLEP